MPPDEVDVCKRAGGIPGEIQGLRLQQNQLLVAENRRRGGVRRIHLEPERRAETASTYRRPTGRKGADLRLIPQVWLPQRVEWRIGLDRRVREQVLICGLIQPVEDVARVGGEDVVHASGQGGRGVHAGLGERRECRVIARHPWSGAARGIAQSGAPCLHARVDRPIELQERGRRAVRPVRREPRVQFERERRIRREQVCARLVESADDVVVHRVA